MLSLGIAALGPISGCASQVPLPALQPAEAPDRQSTAGEHADAFAAALAASEDLPPEAAVFARIMADAIRQDESASSDVPAQPVNARISR
ncbi:MAG: hypothetical protein ACREUE_04435 [Panacagrimonas sp.]